MSVYNEYLLNLCVCVCVQVKGEVMRQLLKLTGQDRTNSNHESRRFLNRSVDMLRLENVTNGCDLVDVLLSGVESLHPPSSSAIEYILHPSP